MHADSVVHLARRRRGRLLRAPAHLRAPSARASTAHDPRRARSATRSSTHFARPIPLCSSRAPKGVRFFATQPPSLPLQSLIAVPLRCKQRLLGWIARRLASPRASASTRASASCSASSRSRAAAAIENARLYEDLQATFQQTIEGLAKAIDKMDRYTAGHSERVATYAHVPRHAARALGRARSRSCARAR